MKLKHIYNKLNIKYVEKNDKISLSRKWNKKDIILNSIFITLFLFMVANAIAYLVPNVADNFKIFYIFSFGIAFGGAIWIFIPFIAIILLLRIINSNMESKSIYWTTRRHKVYWWVFKKKVTSIALMLFIALVLLYHVVLHFVNPELNTFDFNTANLDVLFTKGWWYQFYDLYKDSNDINLNLINNYSVFRNVGFLFDTLSNITYYLSISFISPILLIIILILASIKILFAPKLFIKINGKRKLWFKKSIIDEKTYIKSPKSIFILTESTELIFEFFEFLETLNKDLRLKNETVRSLRKKVLKSLSINNLDKAIESFLKLKANEQIEQAPEIFEETYIDDQVDEAHQIDDKLFYETAELDIPEFEQPILVQQEIKKPEPIIEEHINNIEVAVQKEFNVKHQEQQPSINNEGKVEDKKPESKKENEKPNLEWLDKLAPFD
ncbi:hypothetical protein [Mycoplasmopsis edwardii]|nr:hypothetical protein [Mycoplasmopsis edwardii]